MSLPDTYRHKVIVVGQRSAGKTTLLRRFMSGMFCPYANPTIGLDFLHVTLPKSARHPVDYTLWDTGGAEQYRGLWTHYYRGASAAIVVYDITSLDSYNMAWTVWREEVRQAAPQATILMVGTKSDLYLDRVVDTQEGQAAASRAGYPFFETSACTGDGVTEVFDHLARILSALPPPAKKKGKTLLQTDDNRKRKCCSS